MKLGIVLAVALVACVLADGKAQAQGVQTGSLAGTVRDATGLVLPGVTVTATSAAMQGLRTTVSGGNGDYLLPGLPAGTYTVTFALVPRRSEFDRFTFRPPPLDRGPRQSIKTTAPGY